MSDSLVLAFNNVTTNALPFIFQDVATTPFSESYLVAFSPEAAHYISLPFNVKEHDDFVKIFSGEKLPTGARHTSQVYAGHQFGQFVSQLGDGRSISLGEIQDTEQNPIDIQLKGSGPTPYSRMGDGRAVLRSCVREFLASEAMAALNIPTTRALCITSTNDPVYREKPEHGAIMTRLTPSNIRFGHFEYFFHHNKLEELDQLGSYCLEKLYPECLKADNPHQAMLLEVTHRTATLIAQWQSIGFAHGVMNTDNMSILGLTIDYGPFAFLDNYEPEFICNHSDHQGRYAFDQQPSIGLWNLNALGYTFSRWLEPEDIRTALASYEPTLMSHYNLLMQQKLGLDQWLEKDKFLLGKLLSLMNKFKVDYTLAFRLLNTIFQEDNTNQQCQVFIDLFDEQTDIITWLGTYRIRLRLQGRDDKRRHQQQNRVNPKYILRNYLAETAIRSANTGDFSEIERLRKVLTSPFAEQNEMNAYANQPPAWGREMEISCSS